MRTEELGTRYGFGDVSTHRRSGVGGRARRCRLRRGTSWDAIPTTIDDDVPHRSNKFLTNPPWFPCCPIACAGHDLRPPPASFPCPRGEDGGMPGLVFAIDGPQHLLPQRKPLCRGERFLERRGGTDKAAGDAGPIVRPKGKSPSAQRTLLNYELPEHARHIIYISMGDRGCSLLGEVPYRAVRLTSSLA